MTIYEKIVSVFEWQCVMMTSHGLEVLLFSTEGVKAPETAERDSAVVTTVSNVPTMLLQSNSHCVISMC